MMSLAGLKLITFINDRSAVDRDMHEILGKDNQVEWREGVEQIKQARSDPPPDHFRCIFHEGIDSPTPNDPPTRENSSIGADNDIDRNGNGSEMTPRALNAEERFDQGLKKGGSVQPTEDAGAVIKDKGTPEQMLADGDHDAKRSEGVHDLV
ncbi:hypothetical protein PM082_023919 [Marasmius tenuissimus]|nr:hypothetical protein PM082_023919 [Marasmius tenuissimus]